MTPGEHQDGHEEASDADGVMPPVDFNTFVLTLSTSALVGLGQVPEPDGIRRKDLHLAKHTIDLIGMLQVKTRGNLTGEEERLLDRVLLDLRMKFVEVSGKSGK